MDGRSQRTRLPPPRPSALVERQPDDPGQYLAGEPVSEVGYAAFAFEHPDPLELA